jgi:hypothetical protein
MVCGQGRRYCRKSSVDCGLDNFVAAVAAASVVEVGAAGVAVGEEGFGRWRGRAELRRLLLLLRD